MHGLAEPPPYALLPRMHVGLHLNVVIGLVSHADGETACMHGADVSRMAELQIGLHKPA